MGTHTIFRTSVILLIFAVSLIGCATVAEEPLDEPFTREGLLLDAVDDAIGSGDLGRAVNLTGYGLERELVTRREIESRLQEIAAALAGDVRQARLARDRELAIQAIRNARVLERAAAHLGVDIEPLPERYTVDRELLELSNDYTRVNLPVLALATLMRRASLGDLGDDMLLQAIESAQRYNNDEALARLMTLADHRDLSLTPPQDPVRAPGDRPSTMLDGTVTVWVNRGIAIMDGVGVPDRGIGSGFFVDPRGYILTNYHVIESEVDPTYEGYSRLYIKLPGRPDERIPARVIGYDRIFDLALLKVEVEPSYVFSLSTTRDLEAGQRVLVLGSPAGLESTITSGIVSAGGRRFLQLGEVLQVDAPVNPGNSGGPLVLPDGTVGGVIFAGLEPFEGLNFAIPSYWVNLLFPRLFAEGQIEHAWLGASVRRVRHGLEVVYVAPESPAAVAGVRAGDTLRSIDGIDVSGIPDAHAVLLALQPGAWVTSRWLVEGADVDRIIALDARPYSPVEDALARQPINELFPVLFGMDVQQVAAAPWGPDYVITDVFPGSVADETSLSIDDPFALRTWRVDQDLRAAFIEIVIKRRKAGFLESGVQLGAYLETTSFI